MIGDDYVPESRVVIKMYFHRYLTKFRNEESERGEMVRFMLSTKDFPLTSKAVYTGIDYFTKNNMATWLKIYKAEFDGYRLLENTTTPEIAMNIQLIRLIYQRKNKNN